MQPPYRHRRVASPPDSTHSLYFSSELQQEYNCRYNTGESTSERGIPIMKNDSILKESLKRRRRGAKRKLKRHGSYEWNLILMGLLFVTLVICVWIVCRVSSSEGVKGEEVGMPAPIALQRPVSTPELYAKQNQNLSFSSSSSMSQTQESNIIHPTPSTPSNLNFQIRTENAPQCIPVLPSEVSFTLVSQLSYDRLWMVPQHCSRWGKHHPISIAVFTEKSPSEILSEIQPQCDPASITIQTLPTTGVPKGDYPVNTLRNLALSAVRTTHVMYVDIDFWESENLYDTLHSQYIREEFAQDDKLAVVIPAFSIVRMCREYYDCQDKNIAKMPYTRDDVKTLVVDRKAGPFDPTNRGGHGSTLYAKWFQQDDGTLLDLPCIFSNRYEPYMAFRYCSDLPPFQEEFTGYGKNKMTFVMQMRRSGYLFSQLGGSFVVHYPHLDSTSRMIWNEAPEEFLRTRDRKKLMREVDLSKYKRAQVDKIFVQFREWMMENVEDSERTVMCENTLDDDAKLWVTEI